MSGRCFSLLTVPLSALNERGKTKRPSPFMVVSNAGTDRLGGFKGIKNCTLTETWKATVAESHTKVVSLLVLSPVYWTGHCALTVLCSLGFFG